MAESKKIDAPGNEKKPRILVVDDSKLVRLTANKILSAKFDLVLAEDGEEGWQKISADPSIQVIFTDLGMPNLDGYGLIERIRQSENESIRNQPIIVLTGAAEEEEVKRKVFEIGATDFITKPFKSTEVIARAEAHASYRRDKATLQKKVDTDLLTGTLNRAGLEAQLEKDVSFVNRHSQNLALVIFELDDFKSTYKRIGKETSEKIIKQIATILQRTIRKEDSLGRYDFAKFATVLPMAKTEGVVMLARRLCEHVKSFKLKVGGEPLPITMSVGISAVSKGKPAAAKELIQAADQALTNAKAVGRGEVQILKLDNAQAEADEEAVEVSIDNLLEAIEQGRTDAVEGQMDVIIGRLAPLVALMSGEQKKRLVG